jgi:hypothetical protein
MPKPPQALRPQDAQPAQLENQVRREVHPLDVPHSGAASDARSGLVRRHALSPEIDRCAGRPGRLCFKLSSESIPGSVTPPRDFEFCRASASIIEPPQDQRIVPLAFPSFVRKSRPGVGYPIFFFFPFGRTSSTFCAALLA